MTFSTLMLSVIITFSSVAEIRGDVKASQILLEIYHEMSMDILEPESKGPNDTSLFGFSIAYQRNIENLIVGAPKVGRKGQIYKCTTTDKCEKVPRDEHFDSDLYDWFGARVDAGESFFTGCAPRMPHTINGLRGVQIPSSSGRCYYFDVPSNVRKSMLPNKNDMHILLKKFHRKAYRPDLGQVMDISIEHATDSFGWSSYVNNNNVFIGGPSIGTGRVLKYVKEKEAVLVPVDNQSLLSRGKALSFNFGYSITAGCFLPQTNGSCKDALAISTTYGTIGYGRVYFYDITGTTALDMWVDGRNGSKVGSMFGACLSSLPVPGESAALLVGAPAFVLSSSFQQSSEYDTGAVFIYRFHPTSTKLPDPYLVKKLLPLDKSDRGRFGSAIVNIGDFDGDDIPEIAVAAPIANEGRGVVYIYSGKTLLAEDKQQEVQWKQKLEPKEKDHPAFYGWSLTALDDMDKNGCNELAIGAPRDSSVALFHCIASVNVSFEATPLNFKTLGEKIASGKDTSFKLQLCLKVNRGNMPNRTIIKSQLDFNITLDHTSATFKGKNIDFSSTNQLLVDGYCQELEIFLPSDGDYDEKIKLKTTASLSKDYNPLEKVKFDPSLVLLDKSISYSKEITLDMIELPESNLKFEIQTQLKDNYLIGSTDDATLNITVMNSGSAADRTCFRIPLGRLTVLKMPSRGDVTCSVNKGELICILAKVRRGVSEVISIHLSTKELTSLDKKLELFVDVLRRNCEVTLSNLTKIVHLEKDYNIKIKTYSSQNYEVKVAAKDLDKTGKTIEHKYTIMNNGVTLWKDLECEISLPSQVKVEKVIIGTINCPVTDHKLTCLINLLPKLPVDVRIQMKIEPHSLIAAEIKKGMAKVETFLSLNDTNILNSKANITTKLTVWKPTDVPFWIIILSICVGIFIVILLVFVLRKCGFLQRQNKQELEALKRDINRQSIRKSIRISHHNSKTNSASINDTQSLLDDSDIAVTEDVELQEIQNALAKRLSMQHNDENTGNHGNNQAKEVKEISNGRVKDVAKSNKPVTKSEVEEANRRIKEDSNISDKPPDRVAFNNELAKAIAKGCTPIYTKPQVHGSD